MPTLAHAALNLCAMLLLTVMTVQQEGPYVQLTFIAVLGIVAGLCMISLNAWNPGER